MELITLQEGSVVCLRSGKYVYIKWQNVHIVVLRRIGTISNESVICAYTQKKVFKFTGTCADIRSCMMF
jgi:hypothetical protein